MQRASKLFVTSVDSTPCTVSQFRLQGWEDLPDSCCTPLLLSYAPARTVSPSLQHVALDVLHSPHTHPNLRSAPCVRRSLSNSITVPKLLTTLLSMISVSYGHVKSFTQPTKISPLAARFLKKLSTMRWTLLALPMANSFVIMAGIAVLLMCSLGLRFHLHFSH